MMTTAMVIIFSKATTDFSWLDRNLNSGTISFNHCALDPIIKQQQSNKLRPATSTAVINKSIGVDRGEGPWVAAPIRTGTGHEIRTKPVSSAAVGR